MCKSKSKSIRKVQQLIIDMVSFSDDPILVLEHQNKVLTFLNNHKFKKRKRKKKN